MRRPLSAHYAIVVVDVERYADPARTNLDQLAVQGALKKALKNAFRKSRIPWDEKLWAERGDGGLIRVAPQTSKTRLVASLPWALAAEVTQHNARCVAPERMRLRLALHAGEVFEDARGVAGTAVNLACRLAEAPALKAALAASPGVLALIASDWMFSEVIRHDPAAQPGLYQQVEVSVKETTATAWILAPGLDARQAPAHQDGGRQRRESLAGVTRRIIPAQFPHDIPGFPGREPELSRLESLARDQEAPPW